MSDIQAEPNTSNSNVKAIANTPLLSNTLKGSLSLFGLGLFANAVLNSQPHLVAPVAILKYALPVVGAAGLAVWFESNRPQEGAPKTLGDLKDQFTLRTAKFVGAFTLATASMVGVFAVVEKHNYDEGIELKAAQLACAGKVGSTIAFVSPVDGKERQAICAPAAP